MEELSVAFDWEFSFSWTENMVWPREDASVRESPPIRGLFVCRRFCLTRSRSFSFSIFANSCRRSFSIIAFLFAYFASASIAVLFRPSMWSDPKFTTPFAGEFPLCSSSTPFSGDNLFLL